jgi:hypothetical protein
MLFLLEMQDKWESKAPLLTISDVREIFEVIMPKSLFGNLKYYEKPVVRL